MQANTNRLPCQICSQMTQNKNHSIYAHAAALDMKKYIDDRPLTFRTLAELWAARPGESRSTVEKSFKKVTGFRIKEYLVLVRLEHTKQFLRDGMPIKRVATKSFYKSQSAYCTAFRRFFNQSPTDWLNDGQQ